MPAPACMVHTATGVLGHAQGTHCDTMARQHRRGGGVRSLLLTGADWGFDMQEVREAARPDCGPRQLTACRSPLRTVAWRYQQSGYTLASPRCNGIGVSADAPETHAQSTSAHLAMIATMDGACMCLAPATTACHAQVVKDLEAPPQFLCSNGLYLAPPCSLRHTGPRCVAC